MELTEAIATIRQWRAWARGFEPIDQPDPRDVGQALNALIEHAERQLLGDPQEEPND